MRWDGGDPQVPGSADDRSRLGQGFRGVGAERAPVAADHGDVHALLVHAAASAIFCWPVKSTMMTWTSGGFVPGPPASALNRLSTRAVLALPICSARSSGPPAALVMSASRARSTLDRV